MPGILGRSRHQQTHGFPGSSLSCKAQESTVNSHGPSPSRKICLSLVSSLSPLLSPGSVCSKTWRRTKQKAEELKIFLSQSKSQRQLQLHPCPQETSPGAASLPQETGPGAVDSNTWHHDLKCCWFSQEAISECQFHTSESRCPISGVSKDSFQAWLNHFTADRQTELGNLGSVVHGQN